MKGTAAGGTASRHPIPNPMNGGGDVGQRPGSIHGYATPRSKRRSVMRHAHAMHGRAALTGSCHAVTAPGDAPRSTLRRDASCTRTTAVTRLAHHLLPHRFRAHPRFHRCLGGHGVRAQSGFLHACDRSVRSLARGRRGHRLLDAPFCEVIRDARWHDHHQARLAAIGRKQSTIAPLITVLQDAVVRHPIVVAVPAANAATSRDLARPPAPQFVASGSPSPQAAPQTPSR